MFSWSIIKSTNYEIIPTGACLPGWHSKLAWKGFPPFQWIALRTSTFLPLSPSPLTHPYPPFTLHAFIQSSFILLVPPSWSLLNACYAGDLLNKSFHSVNWSVWNVALVILSCLNEIIYFCWIYHFSFQLVSVLEHSAKLKRRNPIQGEVLCFFMNWFLQNSSLN